MTDFGAVLTNKVAVATFPHVLMASWLTAGVVMMCFSACHLGRTPQRRGVPALAAARAGDHGDRGRAAWPTRATPSPRSR